MSKKICNSSGVKSKNYMEVLTVEAISNGILEVVANFFRITLGLKSF